MGGLIRTKSRKHHHLPEAIEVRNGAPNGLHVLADFIDQSRVPRTTHSPTPTRTKGTTPSEKPTQRMFKSFTWILSKSIDDAVAGGGGSLVIVISVRCIARLATAAADGFRVHKREVNGIRVREHQSIILHYTTCPPHLVASTTALFKYIFPQGPGMALH